MMQVVCKAKLICYGNFICAAYKQFPFLCYQQCKIHHMENDGRCHFTTIPCEPSTASWHIESHFYFLFGKFIPVLATWCVLGLKFLEFFCVL